MISCRNHPDREAAGMCVACGKPFCEDCLIDVKGRYFCKPCIAERIRRLEQKKQEESESQPDPAPSRNVEPYTPPTPASPAKPFKKKSVAFAFWFFLGGIGGHRYYTGHVYSAILYTILWAVSVITFDPIVWLDLSLDTLIDTSPVSAVVSFVLALLCFIDLILIVSNMFDDGEGRPLY